MLVFSSSKTLSRISPYLMGLAVCINLSSLIIACVSSSLVFVWLCIEIRVLRFILILLSSNLSQDYRTTIKYFLFQAMASILFLLSLTLLKGRKSFSLLILIIKLGIAPFHLWFISIIDKISLLDLIWVSIVQKIIPLRFILLLKANESFLLGLGLRFLISSLHIFLQRKLKKIIGASSVYSVCWVLIRRITCEALRWFFFLIYRIFQICVLSFRRIRILSPLKSSLTQNSWSYICLLLLVLRISGFPPSPLFFIKLGVIIQFISGGHLGWGLTLGLGARMVIFNYLNIIRILFTFSPRRHRVVI